MATDAQPTMSSASNPAGNVDGGRAATAPRKSGGKGKMRKEPCGGCGRFVMFNPGGPFCTNPHNKHISHPNCKTAMHMLCRLCCGDRVETVMPELSPEHQDLFEREIARGLPGMTEPDHFPGMETLFQALTTMPHAQLTACLMERIRYEISTDSITSVAAETANAGANASQVAAARTFADIANAVARTVSSTAAAVSSASTPLPPPSSSTSKTIVAVLASAIVTIESIEARPPAFIDRDDLPMIEETISEKGTAIPAYGLATSYAMISILFKTYLEVLPAKNTLLSSQVSDAYIHMLARWAHGLSLPRRPLYVTSTKGLLHSCEICAMRPSKTPVPCPEGELAGKVLHHRARITHRALAGPKEIDDINESIRVGFLALLKMCLADHRRRLQLTSGAGKSSAQSRYLASSIGGDDEIEDIQLADEFSKKLSGDIAPPPPPPPPPPPGASKDASGRFQKQDDPSKTRPVEGGGRLDLEKSRSEEAKQPEAPKPVDDPPK